MGEGRVRGEVREQGTKNRCELERVARPPGEERNGTSTQTIKDEILIRRHRVHTYRCISEASPHAGCTGPENPSHRFYFRILNPAVQILNAGLPTVRHMQPGLHSPV